MNEVNTKNFSFIIIILVLAIVIIGYVSVVAPYYTSSVK